MDRSRRALVAGGASVAAVVVAAGWWTRGHGLAAEPDDRVAVVGGGRMASPMTGAGGGTGMLASWVGQSARIGGEFGPVAATIVEATPLLTGGVRPAGLRALAYQLTFLTDRAGAPRGEAIYPLGGVIDGMDRLFLTRGTDRGDRATLIAIVG